MKLSYDKYLDKVKACYIGKNIGGTLGGPYEWTHDMLDVKGYITPPGQPLPNDDLDLQLAWLHALEQVGPYAIDASMLGEFWLNFIHPCWAEYGIGKANMQRGIAPPASGDLDNDWKHSNGAWIRTEIWACTAPATPETAVTLAMEDAKVDHGAGEGTIAAAFVAALQSCAFALTSLSECIDLALSAIPENSRTAMSVRLVLDSYKAGKTWQETREIVRLSNADIGTGWFEAPSNVAYAVIGMVYGKGDFKKSMLTAINCGDDTDCTAAMVGATMGILHGTSVIPADWAEYIGDEIVTICIANGDVGKSFPKTCTEMASRIAEVMPFVMRLHNAHIYYRDGDAVSTTFGEENIADAYEQLKNRIADVVLPMTQNLVPFTFSKTDGPFNLKLSLSELGISPAKQVTADLTVQSRVNFENMQYPIAIRFLAPDGFCVEGPKNGLIKRHEDYKLGIHGSGQAKFSYTITAPEVLARENRMVVEVTCPGRHTAVYLPFLLLAE